MKSHPCALGALTRNRLHMTCQRLEPASAMITTAATASPRPPAVDTTSHAAAAPDDPLPDRCRRGRVDVGRGRCLTAIGTAVDTGCVPADDVHDDSHDVDIPNRSPWLTIPVALDDGAG